MKTIIRVGTIVLPSGTTAKSISIDVRKTRSELLTAAKGRDHDITLELDVEAERSPGVVFEVELGAAQGKRWNIGNVALYGAGIRSESHGEFKPAHVQLVISDAVAGALKKSSTKTMTLTFTAKRAEGEKVRSTSALTIRNAAIVVGPRLRE